MFSSPRKSQIDFENGLSVALMKRVAAGNRPLVTGPEVLVRTQVAGHEEVHDGPEVGHAVLDGRTGQHEAVVRLDALGGAGVLG